MAGLIGAMLAGGAEGAGQGVAVAGKNWTAELLEAEKQKAIGMREESIARLNNAARASLETDVRQPFEEKMERGRQSAQAVEHQSDRDARAREDSLNRLSNEAIAKLGRDTQMAIAKTHGTVQVDRDGKIQWVGAGGEVKDTGLMAQKDLPASAKAAADILRDQLKSIDKAEQDVMNATPEQQAKFSQQRLRLNGQLLAVLSGDLNKAFSTEQPRVEPPAVAIAALKKDPKLAGQFRQKYPGFDPQQYLGQAEPATSAPLADYPPGSAEAEAEKPQPEGLIARKRRQLEEKKSKDEERKREYGDAGY